MQYLKKKELSKAITEIKKRSGKVWFTSDLHFMHSNIIKYCSRPTTVEEQTEWLIKQLNDSIGPDDLVFHLGDFTFVGPKKINDVENILKRLNGHWKFVLGNHDQEPMLYELMRKFEHHEVLGNYQELSYNSIKLVLCHYPFKTWNCSNRSSINIHGHTHGELNKRHFKSKLIKKFAEYFGFDKRKPTINQIDVGIDAIDGHRPIEIDELMTLVNDNNPKNKTVNHHGRDDISFIEKLKFWKSETDTRNL